MTRPDAPLLIAGAGIGGVALAIRCAQHGIAVRLLEARAELSIDGAGIQLGPNATRVLQRLGVAKRLEAHVCAPPALVVRQGARGGVLQKLQLGDWMASRHGTPYWVMHRADLHRALLAELFDVHKLAPECGWRAVAFDETPAGVTLTSDAGETVAGQAVVAADGLWSRLRHAIVREDRAVPYSGKSAARTVIDRAEAPPGMASENVGVWFSPHGHLVHYPVRAGEAVAVVAVTPSPEPQRGWGNTQSSASMATDVERIAPIIDVAWARAANWRMWGLFDPQPFPAITTHRAALIGDAAHPVLPFLAQGGGLALEDAIVLADLIVKSGSIETAFRSYQKARAARTAKVQATSRRNGRIYQLGGPAAFARDLTLRALPASQVMAGYDWLYGWRNDNECDHHGRPSSPKD